MSRKKNLKAGKYLIQFFAGGLLALIVLAFFVGRNVSFEKTQPVIGQKPVDVKKDAVKKAERIEKEVDVPRAVPAVPEEKKETYRALMAVVIDDAGYTRSNFEEMRSLKEPITLAILPGLEHSSEAAVFARDNGMGIVLHLPMEPEAKTWAREKNTLMAGMGEDDADFILDVALKTVPYARGVSNHMGSRATGDRTASAALMKALKKRGLFFLDSLTTAGSVCREEASLKGVKYYRRDIFLDNQSEIPYIVSKINEAADIAIKKGKAVAIGHDRKNTIAALKAALPGLKSRGVKITAIDGL